MVENDSISVKVLGAAGGYPYGGHACSGFLLGTSESQLLADCGPGVATRLLAHGRAHDIEGVILTHLHPDHALDLIPLGYAILTEWISLKVHDRVPLYLPTGGHAFLQNLAGLFGHKFWAFDDVDLGDGYAALRECAREGKDWMFEVFDVTEFSSGDTLQIAGFEVAASKADHTPEAVSLRFDCAGKRLGYTGDTRYNPDLAKFFKGSDLLIAEGHFSGSHPPGGAHMTPAQAGTLAKEAGAQRLLLTHIAALEDADTAQASAAAMFDGPVDLAIRCDEVVV